MEQQKQHDPLLFREKIFRRVPELRKHGEVRIPNQRFWDFYHANKDMFYQACLSPHKRRYK